MPKSEQHLSEWTLEQLAEEMLPEAEHRTALAHVEGCARCAAELDAYRSLFAALAELPRFAPAPGFSEAVLARVRIAPRESAALAWLRRWLPSTRRGWTLLAAALVAPALPLVALLVWLLSQPLVSPVALWQWTVLNVDTLIQTARTGVLEWGRTVGVAAWTESAYGALQGVPADTWITTLALLAVAIPLSAWTLIRLVRTPTGKVTYAN